ncbi:hypothetical protein F1654_04560 [Alkalicaulis satelles]|uniref:Type II toxin-antitoxin system HicB family antitoxin n=1 Tax=Alkalicaulis satelles TaxID=2609175 RepID=A0A5M6ZKA2_9PROT|nr:hypothetical protein [Alkalicaulis satelles]KAA5805256.1 hypothetical protein F1654_04560 [Alkalicaulis satelles]
MTARSVLCAAYGREGDWEAICLDLDIAVQGVSYEEVRRALDHAIATYIEDVRKERPEVQDKLLHRKAPLLARLRIAFMLMAASVFHQQGQGGRHFEAHRLPCPA